MNEPNTLNPDIYAPGMWKCPHCNFRQHNAVIAPNGVFANDKPELRPCPNDGRDMVPVTWKELAKENEAIAIKYMNENTHLADHLRESRQCKKNIQEREALIEVENARLDEDRKKKLQENARLRGKLRAADAVMMKIDYAIRCGQLNPRTLIADARLDYGNPDEYEFSKECHPRMVQSEDLNHSGDANKMVKQPSAPAAGCPLDTDGDGNCPKHPKGCLHPDYLSQDPTHGKEVPLQ